MEDCKIFKKCQHKKSTKKEKALKPSLKFQSEAFTALERVVKETKPAELFEISHRF